MVWHLTDMTFNYTSRSVGNANALPKVHAYIKYYNKQYLSFLRKLEVGGIIYVHPCTWNR